MARLQEIYRDKVAPELIKQFGYTSPMQVPRLTKITLNMGVSEAVSDKKVMDKFSDAKPIVLRYGERVRFVLVNDTMMTHPIRSGPVAPWCANAN